MLVSIACGSSTPTTNPTSTSVPIETFVAASTPIYGFSCVPINTLQQTGIAVKIVDGDTIDVILEDGKTYPVRYIGINTPEKGETGYQEATDKNTELVLNKIVFLVSDVSDTDKYNRLLRYVFVDNVFINNELLKSGVAEPMKYPPDISCSDFFSKTYDESINTTLPLVTPTYFVTPTTNSVAVCDCSGNKYNCGDFSTHAKAQSCFDYCISIGVGDINELDRDGDRLVCESLP